MEVFCDGSKSFVATICIISREGMAITARHTVVCEDGFIHPRRLWVADGVALKHLVSWPHVDVSLFQLTRRPGRGAGSSGDVGGSSSGGGSVDGGTSSSGSRGGGAAVSAEEPWPFLEIAPQECYKPGTMRPGDTGRIPATAYLHLLKD